MAQIKQNFFASHQNLSFNTNRNNFGLKFQKTPCHVYKQNKGKLFDRTHVSCSKYRDHKDKDKDEKSLIYWLQSIQTKHIKKGDNHFMMKEELSKVSSIPPLGISSMYPIDNNTSKINEIAHYQKTIRDRKKSMFNPRNDAQRDYQTLLVDGLADIVLAIGPAGTSKTMCATIVGLEKLINKEVEKVVFTRPAVSADEELGFLKGDLEDKMKPWLLPIMDTLEMYMSKEDIEKLMKSSKIEICSLAHMRGRTFRNAFVVVDEAQNTTPSQMLMLLTRIGEGSQFVFTGDIKQHDRKKENSGLQDFIFKFQEYVDRYNLDENMLRIKIFTFLDQHIERHHVIPFVLSVYDNV